MSDEIKPAVTKLFSQPFHEWLNLVLRSDDWIKIPIDLGLVVQTFDPCEYMVHIEFPSASNPITYAQLWSKRAWQLDELSKIRAKERAAAERIAIDNLKINRDRIIRRLKELTQQDDYDTLLDMAIDILKANPENLSGLGVELVKPYYKGVYQVLKTRNYYYES